MEIETLPSKNKRLSDQLRRPADLAVDEISRAGVRTVFGIPGAAISPVFDALCDHREIELVVPKHEMNAVFGAIGYARASRGLGVAFVTAGPGILNAVTPLASANLDGVPVLVLVGEARRSTVGRGALQEGGLHGLGIVNMLRPVTKLALELPHPQAAPFTIRRAIDTAMSGKKGPVVLTFPLDVATTPIQVPHTSQRVFTHFELEDGPLEAAAKALARSPSSVLFIGNGCRWGNAPALIRQLAERLAIPVMTTPKGKGIFPESHPLALGVFGMGGHPSTREHLEKGVEVLVAMGTRMGELSSQGWSTLLNPERTLIHVDIEAMQVGRSYATHISVSAPVELFLDRLLKHPQLEFAEQRATPKCGIRFFKDPSSSDGTAPGKVAPHRAVVEIAKAVGPRGRYLADSGEHMLYAIHYLPAQAEDMWLLQLGLGPMGASVGAALGVQAQDRTRPVVVMCGDGGFLMCPAEVATAAQSRLPIIFAVFNDHRLGMTELGHHAFYGRTPKFPTGPADLAALAQSLGADGQTITSESQIATLGLEKPRTRPLVLDIQVDASAVFSKDADTKRSWITSEVGPTGEATEPAEDRGHGR